MSRAELALVIKLQLNQLQLQSGAGSDDSFYAHVWQLRKGRRALSKSLAQMPPIMQQHPQAQQARQQAAASSPYAALLSGRGGALGKLQASSLKKPKRLMDLAQPADSITASEQHTVTASAHTTGAERTTAHHPPLRC